MEQEQMIELVKKSQAGDQTAFSELLQAAHTSISYQCRKLLKREQDAEDVTQEVMITLYQKLDTLQEPAAFWGWLNRITANRCKNALSRTHVDLQIAEDEDGHSMLDDIENTDKQLVPDEAIDNAETTRMIEEIVDALPEAQKMCTLLFYYDEMSVKEIAEIMGTSENTVKSRLNYARKAMKESVLDYEKKQGIRLHSLSPIPFLLYFLHKAADTSADPAAAQTITAQVMSQGAAVAGTAASTAAMSAESVNGVSASGIIGSAASASSASGTTITSSAAGSIFSHILGGISLKATAGAITGLLIMVGAAAGISAAVSNSASSVIEHISTEAEDQSAVESAAEIPTTEALAEEEYRPLVDQIYLLQLPYTGDITKCTMTAEQAKAFAEILDNCFSESQENQDISPSEPRICRTALFDAGGGIPALIVTEGYDMSYGDDSGYMPYLSKIYCWNGEQTVLFASSNTAILSVPIDSWDSSQAMIERDRIRDCVLTDQGLLLDYSDYNSSGSSSHYYSILYSLSDGMISQNPAHVYESLFFMQSDMPTTAQITELLNENGYPGISYDYSTLTINKWRQFDEEEVNGVFYDGAGWIIDILDGTFLHTEAAFASGQALTWRSVNWLLGHGSVNITDASYYWKGAWGDAEKVAELLRNGADDAMASLTAQVTPSEDSGSNAGTVYKITGVTEYDSDGALRYHSARTYDDNGNILTDKSYDSDGNLNWWSECQYDENGNLIEKKYYNGSSTRLCKHIYDENGKEQSYTTYNIDGTITDSCEYYYEDNKQLSMTVKSYDTDGKSVRFWYEFTSKYNAEGQETSIEYRDSDDTTYTVTELFYSENGYLQRFVYYNPDGTIAYIYQYDEDGATTEMSTYTNNTVAWSIEYIYDEYKNQLISSASFYTSDVSFPDGMFVCGGSNSTNIYKYSYDDNGCATGYEIYSDGILTGWGTLEY